VAFGPAVAVDLERGSIQVECTVAAEGDAEVERAASRIREIALAAFARSEYQASVSTLDALPV
jgi:hypothetical protein